MTLLEILCPSCALFLDFDGTMVDIAPRPDAVAVPPELVGTLQWLQDYLQGAVAVVSGRPLEQIDAFLRPLKLPAAGVHGAERRGSDGQLRLAPTHNLEPVLAAAQALAARHPQLLVEQKRGSLALHYRLAPELEALCLETLQAAVEQAPGVALMRGKMVVEAKPRGASKGRAIEEFLREPPFAGRTPVFIGDDFTDEIGFSAVQRRGGLGVKIGSGPSVAWQRLPDPEALRQALQAVRTGRPTRRPPTQALA